MNTMAIGLLSVRTCHFGEKKSQGLSGPQTQKYNNEIAY